MTINDHSHTGFLKSLARKKAKLANLSLKDFEDKREVFKEFCAHFRMKQAVGFVLRLS